MVAVLRTGLPRPEPSPLLRGCRCPVSALPVAPEVSRGGWEGGGRYLVKAGVSAEGRRRGRLELSPEGGLNKGSGGICGCKSCFDFVLELLTASRTG